MSDFKTSVPLRDLNLDEYTLENGNHLFVIADGRVANLVYANGNPADVMDMSFSVMAFGVEYLVKNNGKLENHMLNVPLELDHQVVRLKLGPWASPLISRPGSRRIIPNSFSHMNDYKPFHWQTKWIDDCELENEKKRFLSINRKQ